MTLNNIKKMKDERGFTIVELLIVIVVIAILAAIVIVAYTGVTNNARNSNYKANAAQIQKVAEAINADNGSLPTGTDTTTLQASFATGTTTKLPSGVNVKYAASAPTNANATTDADTSPTALYSVKVCAGGLNIYYPVRGGSLQTLKSGADCGA
jgi:prepilin-type N-terminal cleavage/methylation domain-containing protein